LDVPTLPTINAVMNATATVCLLAGLRAIHRQRREVHARWMVAALAASALFLAGYLTYHFGVQRAAGPTPFRGTGIWRTGYFVLLVTHIVGAIVNLPMVLTTFWFAHRERWDAHRRLARWTFPLWLYVSVTGVVVYLALYWWNPVPSA
jgi:uncharacterized membrane protein YozB (DUF420 family)